MKCKAYGPNDEEVDTGRPLATGVDQLLRTHESRTVTTMWGSRRG